jgi:superoxide dismutase, Cu-Zn family
MMNSRLFFAMALLVLPLGSGCRQDTEMIEAPGVQTETGQQGASMVAVAEIQPASGSNVRGTVTFERVAGDQVRVAAHVTGLTPGRHGFHIHQYGDCSAPDAMSAGDHFNPTDMPHGDPSPQHHMGDLGNIEADQNGEAHLELTLSHLIMEGPDGIVGKAVLVHADPDDLSSQPAGNAGARIGCGVIQVREGL